MPTVTSKFKTGLDNLGVDVSQVNKVKRGPSNPQLSVLYFYGPDQNNREKVVRTWFYSRAEDREKEVRRIQEKYPHLPID